MFPVPLRTSVAVAATVATLASVNVGTAAARHPGRGGVHALGAPGRVAVTTLDSRGLAVRATVGRRDRVLVLVLRRDGRVAARHAFASRRGGRVRIRWRLPALAPGSYLLRARSGRNIHHLHRRARQTRIEITAPAAPGAPAPAPAPPPAVVASPVATGVGGAIAPPANGVFMGAWTSSNTGYTMEQREAQIARRYKIVHEYHDWDEAFPTPAERALAEGGQDLFLAWESRIYGGGVIRWASIASGAQDAQIDATAAHVKALGRPVFMDFMHEPEDWVTGNGGLGDMGTAADFAAAYRHVVERFRQDGASNVAWVWTVMGYSGYDSLYSGGLYPGDDVVDWIAWDPYNWYSCHSSAWKSFATTVSSFYGWLAANGHANKPFMLAEFGSRENNSDPLAKGRWFTDALGTLKSGAFPNLKAMLYFDSQPSECDWRVDTSQASLDGFRQLADDPYLNP